MIKSRGNIYKKEYTKKNAIKDAQWIRKNKKIEKKVGIFKGMPIVTINGKKYLKVKNNGKYSDIIKYNYILL